MEDRHIRVYDVDSYHRGCEKFVSISDTDVSHVAIDCLVDEVSTSFRGLLIFQEKTALVLQAQSNGKVLSIDQ